MPVSEVHKNVAKGARRRKRGQKSSGRSCNNSKMGICRSKPAAEASGASAWSKSSAKIGKKREKQSHQGLRLHRSNTDATASTASTSALVHSFFAIAQPIIRRVISKKLIERVGLLRDEIPVEKYDEDQPDHTLPIKPLAIQFEDVHVIDPDSLQADMEAMPDFEWPERENYRELMTHCTEGGSVDMVVLDLIDFDGELRMDRGVEVVVPVKGPFGTQMELEIGYGNDIEEGWVRIRVPKLRIWYVNGSKKLYIAFMDRPDLIPCLNVNVDRGKGDFLSVNFTEEGGLDDVVEEVLSGFGPNLRKRDSSGSYVGTKVGSLIVSALSKFKNIGNGKPLEVTLEQAIMKSINKAMGKSRPPEVIKADIKRLENELEQSMRETQPESKWKNRLHLHSGKHNATSKNEEDDTRDDLGMFCGMHTMFCCGGANVPRE